MKIVDSHNHFWKYISNEYAWISDDLSLLKKDYLPEDLKPVFERNGVSASIAVQARQNHIENELLLAMAEQHSFIEGVVGWVDLTSADVEESLQKYAAYSKLAGIRHTVQSEREEGFMLRKDFLSGVGKLKNFGLTYDILISADQLPMAVKFAEKLPDHKLVLDHIAKPPIKEGLIDDWKNHIFEIGRNENVFCKISGLVTEADWENWKEADLIPYLDIVFEAFGPGRLMFGSDWPVCLLAANYDRVLQLVKKYIAHFDKQDQEKILGLNAMTFYDL